MKKHYVKLIATMGTFMFALPAFAQDGGAGITDKGLMYLAAGLAIGIASFGGAIGQSRAAATALEGIARNPSAAEKIQTPMILGLALIESLVLFAFVIAMKLSGIF